MSCQQKKERQKKYRQSDGFILPKKVGNATGEDVEPHWGQAPLTNGSTLTLGPKITRGSGTVNN